MLCILASCSPKIVEHVRTETVYRDRIVHDTATVTVPVEIEKVVTKDTVSHLENSFAKSDAVVAGGFLSHSLESKPQIIRVPVKVRVTDTVYRKAEVITQIKKVEKELSWWQRVRLDAFWVLLFAVLALLAWIFRKPLLKLVGGLV